MEGVKDMVDGINGHLESSLEKVGVKNVLTFGIAENVVSKNQQFPVFFRTKDGRWAGFDDKKEVVIYHKLNSVVSTLDTSYGDSDSNLVNNYSMSMYVYFDSVRTKFQKDEMFAFLQAVMPSRMKGDKFTYIRTVVSGAILNTMQVFTAEYRGIPYSLKPEQNLISVNYSLEGRFRKGCFNCCPEETNLIAEI